MKIVSKKKSQHLKKETKVPNVQQTHNKSLSWSRPHFFLLHSQEFLKAQFKLHTIPPIWLDSRPIWWTTSPWPVLLHLCHSMAQRLGWIYRKKHIDPSPDTAQTRRIVTFMYFYIFPIWSTPFGKFYPKSMNPHGQIKNKFLDEIFHLRENGDFSQFRKILQFAENDNLYLEEKFH